MSTEEDAQTLTRLGLTILQAEVYLTLAKLGKATIKAISTATNVDRANVYRVISKLQELSLVEKMITKPIAFKAISIHEGIPMLLERKAKEYKETEEKTKELLQRSKESNTAETSEEGCQFILIPEERAISRKIANIMENSHKSHDVIFYWKGFRHLSVETGEMWKNLLEKGVRIRFIVSMPEKGETLPKNIQSLKKSGLFEFRYTSTPPPATISIFDEKETLITILPTPDPSETPSLWSNNPGLIAIIQDYFELMWRNSTQNNQ